MRGLVSGLLAFAVAALVTSPAFGDRVFLTNGNFLEGQAEVLDDGSVAVTSAMGTWTVPAHRVARVERAETVEEHVAAVLRATPAPEASVLYDLAVWCRDRGAVTLARQLAQRAIELEPGHEPSRRLLGYRYQEGRWLSEEEWRRANAPARTEEDRRADRELAWREAEARLDSLSARLELERAARELQASEARERRTESYGFPLSWVLSAPSAPGVAVGVPAYTPIGGLVPLPPPPAPVRARAPSAMRTPAPAPPPTTNRGRFLPPS